MTEHLRMNGVYWGLVALCIMDKQDALDREEMIRYVMSCWDEEMGEFHDHLESRTPAQCELIQNHGHMR